MSHDLDGFERWDDVRARLAAGPEHWAELDDGSLAGLHFLACAETALPDGSQPGPAHEALFRFLVERFPADLRREIVVAYYEQILQSPGLVAPLLSFFLLDPDLAVASLAACGLVDVWECDGSDPLAAPRAVAAIGFASPEPRVRAATLSGLVGFGDPRLREIWDGRWRDLPRDTRRQLWKHLGGLNSTEAVECLLRWLERGPVEDTGGVAGSLYGVGECYESVWQGRQDFTTPGTLRAGCQPTAIWTVAEYGQEIAARVRAIAAAEEGPDYVLPWTAEVWGIDVSGVVPAPIPWAREAG